MNSQYRIFVKALDELPVGKTDRVVDTCDVGASEVYSTMRQLEQQYPPAQYLIQSKELNPLGL